jgi:hypothetical protein
MNVNEVDTEDLEAISMEMSAALISMSGGNEVFIPQRVLPMHGFSIMRRQEDGGYRVRLVYDDPANDPTGKDTRS